MMHSQQTTIIKGWRTGWRCERIRVEIGDSTLTDKEISTQLHVLIPKWHEYVQRCKIMRTEPMFDNFEKSLGEK